MGFDGWGFVGSHNKQLSLPSPESKHPIRNRMEVAGIRPVPDDDCSVLVSDPLQEAYVSGRIPEDRGVVDLREVQEEGRNFGGGGGGGGFLILHGI